MKNIVSDIKKIFEVTHEELDFYLGMELRRERRNKKLFLRQKGYIMERAKKFRMDDEFSRARAKTPMVSGLDHTYDDELPRLSSLEF